MTRSFICYLQGRTWWESAVWAATLFYVADKRRFIQQIKHNSQ
jgi:hypothetical protein